MYPGLTVNPPFFEIGPKAMMYGKRLLKFAKHLDHIAEEYCVQIILTPQYTDLAWVADATQNLFIFAQHMDPVPLGRGVGSVLPEAVKEAGAVGVMLNHAEKKLALSDLHDTIQRADEIGLATMVCADSIEEAAAVAHLSPNIIVAEQTKHIGSGQPSSMNYIKQSMDVVKLINPDILVLQGAGIRSNNDVSDAIRHGAEAVGCSSGIFQSHNPERTAQELIAALRQAWEQYHLA